MCVLFAILSVFMFFLLLLLFSRFFHALFYSKVIHPKWKNAKLCAERHLSECQEHKKAGGKTERTIMYIQKEKSKRKKERRSRMSTQTDSEKGPFTIPQHRRLKTQYCDKETVTANEIATSRGFRSMRWTDIKANKYRQMDSRENGGECERKRMTTSL